MDAASAGKYIILGGLLIAAAGAVVYVLAKAGIPLGSLPGDIRIERKGFSFSFPVVTCIILSIILTILITVLARIFKGRP